LYLYDIGVRGKDLEATVILKGKKSEKKKKRELKTTEKI
jgi:hypothetical protein